MENGAWVEAMRALYRRVDADLAARPVVCRGCGECCHFDTVDHILYASELERRFLAHVSTFPPHPDASEALLADGLRCPYQVEGRCEAREGRTLGCRMHFCRWDDAEAEEDVAEKWHRELKQLHDALGVPWEYRPLLPLLHEKSPSIE